MGGTVMGTRMQWILFAVLLLYTARLSQAVNCYHGIVTTGDTDALITEPNFWTTYAGDARFAAPVNCTKQKGEGYDTCSVSCRLYKLTQTDKPMASCRRFCMTALQCNQTRFKDYDECERLKFLNKGNTMLVDCTQKCTVRDNGNFEAKCTELSPGYCGRNLTVSTGEKAAEAPPTPIAAIVAPIAAFVLLCICVCIYILYKRRQSKV